MTRFWGIGFVIWLVVACARCDGMATAKATLLVPSDTPSTLSPVATIQTGIVSPNMVTATPTEPLTGKIVFSSDRGGNWEIYVVNADGSGLSNLTNHPADDLGASWTPDGRIIFASNRDGQTRVDPETGSIIPIFYQYVMNADGSEPERLPWVGSEPDWSKDDRIVYERVVSDVQGIRVYIAVNDPRGSDEHILASGMAPKWSPDSQLIAFVRYPNTIHNPPGQLWVMRPDGSGKTLLLEAPLIIHPVAWSPDGMEIAFAGDSDVVAVRLVDGQVRHIRAGPFIRCTSWSPDGRWLACECKQNICAVHMTTGQVIQLTPAVSSYYTDMFADWAP